jgi:RNA polymerase sigma-70 factor, ECF subfamily
VETSTTARPTATARDDALVERARVGDATAFETLVATRIDRCYRLAWAILLNDQDAADATQDAFVAAWRQLPRLRETAAFDGWLNRIVANSARMARRHRTRLREIPVVPASPDEHPAITNEPLPDPFARTEIDQVAELDAIGRAFDRLRVDERAILALHHVEERTVAEIARSLGIAEGTAKSRLHTARRALERAMEAEA